MDTAPLFHDLPVPPPRRQVFAVQYCPKNKAMRTAIQFAMQLVQTADPQRKRELKDKMMLAILAKDGV